MDTHRSHGHASDEVDRLEIWHRGEVVGRLSRALVEKQCLTDEAIDGLVRAHQAKHSLFDLMANIEEPSTLRSCAAFLETLESTMQAFWGFDVDPRYHEWYLIPKCTCHKGANIEERQKLTGIRHIASDCPVHS
jgi:hypothetical protein